jgi:N-acetylmuramoyl-L-alanine amidase
VKKKRSNRKFIVFTCLMGTLTLTSVLLLMLAPAPLTPEVATSLFAVDTSASLDPIFESHSPADQQRWKYIYVHQSRTAEGTAATAGQSDHFVIGNGQGSLDGEIQVTQLWSHQESVATPPKGVQQIDPNCISICLIGDFDHTRPTATQQRRLTQLVSALQSHLRIPASQVWLMDQPASPAGIGQLFPTAAFRNQILP